MMDIAATVGSIGSKTTPIMIALSTYKGARLVDIRKYYRDSKSGDLVPTKKGIALQSRNFQALVSLLDESQEVIGAWLQGGSEAERQGAEAVLRSRLAALEVEARKPQEVRVEGQNWRAPNFFEVRAAGGSGTLVYNRRHLFTQWIDQCASERSGGQQKLEITKAIDRMLVAYSHAKSLLMESDEMAPRELFASLEFEWGLILTNYLEELKADSYGESVG